MNIMPVALSLMSFGFVVVMSIFLWTSDKVIEWVFYDLILRWR